MRNKRLWSMAVVGVALGLATVAFAQPHGEVAVITLIDNGAGAWEARVKVWDQAGAGIAPNSPGLMDAVLYEVAGTGTTSVTDSLNVLPQSQISEVGSTREVQAGFCLLREDHNGVFGHGIMATQRVGYDVTGAPIDPFMHEAVITGIGVTATPMPGWFPDEEVALKAGPPVIWDADTKIATGTYSGPAGGLALITNGKISFSVLVDDAPADGVWDGPRNDQKPWVTGVVTQVMTGGTGNNGGEGAYYTETDLTVEDGTYNMRGNTGTSATLGTPAVPYVNAAVVQRYLSYDNPASAASKLALDSNQDLLSLTVDYAAVGLQSLDLNSGSGTGEHNAVRIYGGVDAPARAAIETDLLAAIANAAGTGTEDGIFDSGMAGHTNSAIGVTDQQTDENGDPMVVMRLTRMGDADCDGHVEIDDFNALSSGWDKPGKWDNGDFTGDAYVDINDFNALSTNWDQYFTPEPATMVLLAVGASLVMCRRRTKR